jgi:hypothetical protein
LLFLQEQIKDIIIPAIALFGSQVVGIGGNSSSGVYPTLVGARLCGAKSWPEAKNHAPEGLSSFGLWN